MIITIKEKLSLSPEYCNLNIKENLLKKLKKNMINKCSFQYGYILDIISLLKWKKNEIDEANSLIIFNIVYKANILKPKIGLKLSGPISYIFSNGIFINIKEKLQILVPLDNLKPYEYIKDKKIYKIPNKECELILDKIVDIEITQLQYTNSNFNIIGKLILI